MVTQLLQKMIEAEHTATYWRNLGFFSYAFIAIEDQEKIAEAIDYIERDSDVVTWWAS